MALRVLIYCRHTVGLGDLSRMHGIARAPRDHEVVLATDSHSDSGLQAPEGLRTFPLLPVRRDLATGQLFVPDASVDIEKLLADRRVALATQVQQFRPDVLMVEFYPFERSVGNERRRLPALR
jgi:predicted glycosyltransferase